MTVSEELTLAVAVMFVEVRINHLPCVRIVVTILILLI